jgi:hypothetical protein
MVEEVWEKVVVALFALIMIWSILIAVVFAINAISAEDIESKVIHIAVSAAFATISVLIACIIKHEFIEQ